MFDALLAALDDRRTEFLDGLRSVSPDQRARTPASNAWSPLQIGEHLLLTERGLGRITARQIEKGADRRPVGEPSEVSVRGLLRAMRTPAQFRIPDGARGIAPSGEVPFDELERAWAESGRRWHEIVASLPADLRDEALVAHPVGGPMTTAQTLQFLEAHIEHHLHQLARTARALNAPAA